MRGNIFWVINLIILIINAHSFLLQESEQEQSKQTSVQNIKNEDSSSLQFIDVFGSGVNQQHIITFKNAINSASSFYRDDDPKRLRYIADRMDQAYYVEGEKFAIYQDAVFDGQYRIYVDPDYMYASIAPGSDRIFPQRSYFFNRFNATQKKSSFFLISGAKGEGITAEIEEQLLEAVQNADTFAICNCSRALNSFMNSLPDWNYFCYTDAKEVMYYLYASDDQYYALKGKNCYFAIFK